MLNGPQFAMGAADEDLLDGVNRHAVTMAQHGVEDPEPIQPGLLDRMRRIGDRAKEFVRYFSGRTFPTTTAADRPAGEAVSRWAASPEALEAKRDELTGAVLGGAKPDAEAVKIAGVVLNEDNARGTTDELNNRAAALEREGKSDEAQKLLAQARQVKSFVGAGGYWPDEAAYQRDAARADVRAIIGRFRDRVNPVMEDNFRTAQRIDPDTPTVTRGRDFGARVNRLAVLDGDSPRQSARMATGAGNSESNKIGATAFGKQARGTGDVYNTSIPDMIAASLKGNWSKARQLQAHDALIKAGLAAYSDSPSPVKLGDRQSVPFAIDNWKNAPAKYLQVRSDVAPEFRRALNRDAPTTLGPITDAAKLFNTATLAGPSEVIAHTTNILAALARRPFRGDSPLGVIGETLTRAGVPLSKLAVNVAATAAKIPAVLRDSPEVQRAWSQIADFGAGRSGHEGASVNPLTWNKAGGKFLEVVDKSARLVLNDTFDELVRRDSAVDTPTNRREFVNAAGQYSRRAQGDIVRLLRDSQLSPFATAVKQGMVAGKEIGTLDPGYKASTPVEAFKARAEQALSVILSPIVAVATINTMTVGKPLGREGVPVGAVDLGTDDEQGRPKFTDAVLRLSGLRRFANLTGLSAGANALKNGQPIDQAEAAAARQAGNTLISLIGGPVVRAASVAVTGREPFLDAPRAAPAVKEGPYTPQQAGANLKAAAVQANPVVAGAVAATQPNGTIGDAMDKTLGGYAPKSGMKPGKIEALPKIVGLANLNAYIDDQAKRLRAMPRDQRADAMFTTADGLSSEDRMHFLKEMRRRRVLASD